MKRPATSAAGAALKKPAGKMVSLEFPKGFIWGSATAAYQIEGAAFEGGRTACIWDTFCAQEGKVKNGDNGTTACDHYHRFKEDVKLMKELNLPAYRFSISWSRLLPKGRGEPNPEAIKFYSSLLDELHKNNIKPYATIYHWDLPQCLEDEYGGWLSRKVVDDFEHYAATCFKCFGDRCKAWITFNEPWCSTVLGYANGEMAPGKKEKPETEPYIAAHHIILSHARAVKRYREEFKAKQGGVIGITLNMDWRHPLTEDEGDKAAAQRALDWQLGWFADPIWKGDYPASMRKRCGDRLPSFSEEEKQLIKGTSEFFGLNHYSTAYVAAPKGQAKTVSMWGNVQAGGYFDDQEVELIDDPRWGRSDMDWGVVPWGLKHMCEYIQQEYKPEGGILVTENGCACPDDDVNVAKFDSFRVEFYQGYIAQMHKAIEAGADVRGYFAWSLMDNFEWALGYSKRFGMVHIDYETQKRTPKQSALLISEVAKSNKLTLPESTLQESDFVMIEEGAGRKTTKDAPPGQKEG
ncbi:BGL1A [Symbiodinium natans]|uniref:beta-glucosidase n=1 Tax=Symbiodinium natans TaxID=878477 RepID=A0A812SEM7_9DINO|nr:BGL1A [Symbiodinium natans]